MFGLHICEFWEVSLKKMSCVSNLLDKSHIFHLVENFHWLFKLDLNVAVLGFVIPASGTRSGMTVPKEEEGVK